MPPSLSRAQACLIGQFAGDNLGALVEFKSRHEIEKLHPRGAGLDKLIDGGVWNLTAGQPTDDSEMALALARSLVAEGGYYKQAVIRAYLRWDASHPFDMGGTTRSAMMALSIGRHPETGTSQANGAMMRAAPIGIAFAGNPYAAAEAARWDARLTHSNPVCGEANAAYCAAIASGINGGDTDAMISAASRVLFPGDAGFTVRSWLVDAERQLYPKSYSDQMGWVKIAFINAFGLLAADTSFKDGVIGTVRLGGDTDTNAAIAGALLGARQGLGAVPEQWTDAVLACEAGPYSMRPRPAEYWPSDAFSLAQKLLALAVPG